MTGGMDKQPALAKRTVVGMHPVLDKQRLDQIERWADYVLTNPDWKKHHTEFIDAQFDMARKFWARILSQPGGKKRLRKIYGIENEKALP
ncbi:MAG: hypothetical protein AABX47_00480 [Nanoarchaeota archaeon]